jgi:hypothetical protein
MRAGPGAFRYAVQINGGSLIEIRDASALRMESGDLGGGRSDVLGVAWITPTGEGSVQVVGFCE